MGWRLGGVGEWVYLVLKFGGAMMDKIVYKYMSYERVLASSF